MIKLITALALSATPVAAGYVEGSLQPVEVCRIEMRWIETPYPESDDGQETPDIQPPGERMTWGDVEFPNPTKPPTHVVDHWTAPPPDKTPPVLETPIPAAGWLFFTSVCAILCAIAAAKRKERCLDKIL